MIQGNYLYQDYWSDLAKRWGLPNTPQYSADSWVYDLGAVPGGTSNQYIDFLLAGAFAPAPITAPTCFFHGSWNMYIYASTFTTTGGCIVDNAFSPIVGVQNTQQRYTMASRQQTAADSFVSAVAVIPQAQQFQYSDTVFSNAALVSASGALNVWRVLVKFDGVRITF